MRTHIILAQNGYGQLEHIHLKMYITVVYISGQKKGDVVYALRDYQLRIQDNALTQQFKFGQNSQIDIVIETNIHKLLV